MEREPDGTANSVQARANLLDHAVRTVPHYAQYRGAKSTEELPLLSKTTIRESPDALRSSVYDPQQLTATHTSGSYGTPLTFYHTHDKRYRIQAEVLYFGRWVGLSVGVPHALIRPYGKTKLTLWLQAEVHLDPTYLDQASLRTWCSTILRNRAEVIVGHPTAMTMFLESCSRSQTSALRSLVRTFIATGEALLEQQRSFISQEIDCVVVSRYGSAELGILAQECPECMAHHLNTASYHVEVLRTDSLAPAAPETLGRVVVTDLHSYAMPLIRYDIGDLAMAPTTCSCGRPGPVLGRIEGRLVEIIEDTSGRPVSPMYITDLVRDLQTVLQFQVVQRSRTEYVVRLVPLRGYAEDGLVTARFKTLLGEDASVQVNHVDQIPALASGKRPYVINEWARTR